MADLLNFLAKFYFWNGDWERHSILRFFVTKTLKIERSAQSPFLK